MMRCVNLLLMTFSMMRGSIHGALCCEVVTHCYVIIIKQVQDEGKVTVSLSEWINYMLMRDNECD